VNGIHEVAGSIPASSTKSFDSLEKRLIRRGWGRAGLGPLWEWLPARAGARPQRALEVAVGGKGDDGLTPAHGRYEM
jgi:hypothetical protein